MICKLDRLARSTQHLLAITERLKAKGVALRVLNLGLDTSTPTGALLLTMLGAIGQFEREMMLERQPEGIAKAVHKLAAEGVGTAEIGRRLGMHPRVGLSRTGGLDGGRIEEMFLHRVKWSEADIAKLEDWIDQYGLASIVYQLSEVAEGRADALSENKKAHPVTIKAYNVASELLGNAAVEIESE